MAKSITHERERVLFSDPSKGVRGCGHKELRMNNEEKTYLPKLEGHGCFACGTANPIG
ncbi:MAG: hypothetical protein JRJ60_22300, partial [Deltaproteobacteria bacterium]|nr:hypothetical protein [Deltaproteobacteria bacterium]